MSWAELSLISVELSVEIYAQKLLIGANKSATELP